MTRHSTDYALADALPPASLFAVVGSVETGESEHLRRRSLAGAAARSLRAIVAALAVDVSDEVGG